MSTVPRRKSPRAPSIPLNEALDRVFKIYDKERLHPAPVEVVANDLGYKSANNGAALSTIACLRYFGLLERPREGALAVSKDVEAFRFAPDEKVRQKLLVQFLRFPTIYADLLDQYGSGLPSEATLKYDLIKRGFLPDAADATVVAFKKSVEFAGYFSNEMQSYDEISETQSAPAALEAEVALDESKIDAPVAENFLIPETMQAGTEAFDRVPVRLSGGRKAWLVIPLPFYEADKIRLKAQIDLFLCDDDA